MKSYSEYKQKKLSVQTRQIFLAYLTLCRAVIRSILCRRSDGAAAAAAAAGNHVSGHRRRSAEGEQEKDEKAAHHLLKSSASAAEPSISTNSISGSTRESGTGRDARPNTNTGQQLLLTTFNTFAAAFTMFYSVFQNYADEMDNKCSTSLNGFSQNNF